MWQNVHTDWQQVQPELTDASSAAALASLRLFAVWV